MIFVNNLTLRVNFSVMADMTVMIATTDVHLQEKSQAQFLCYGCYGSYGSHYRFSFTTDVRLQQRAQAQFDVMVVMAVMVDTSHFRLQPNVHVNFSVMAVMAVMVVTSHFRLQPNVQVNLMLWWLWQLW